MSELPNDSTPLRGRNPNLPSADTVKQALVTMGATSQQIDDVLWLLGHAKDRRFTTNGEVGDLITKDASVISKVFRGTYEADLEAICKAIRVFRGQLPLAFGDLPFVTELTVVQKIYTHVELARATQTMALIWGPNQSGKTEGLQYCCKAINHGRVAYVRTPVGGSARMTLEATAKALKLSERSNYAMLRQAILNHVDSNMVLIFDEVHQALIGRNVRVNTMELFREIHDICRCGVVLCGTDVLPDMIQDERFKKLLGQTDNRGVLKLQVPAAPTRKDVRLLCEAWGLAAPQDDAKKIVQKIADKHGIGRLCKYFQMSRRLAARQKRVMAWEHFLTTHATLEQDAKGQRSEEEENEE